MGVSHAQFIAKGKPPHLQRWNELRGMIDECPMHSSLQKENCHLYRDEMSGVECCYASLTDKVDSTKLPKTPAESNQDDGVILLLA